MFWTEDMIYPTLKITLIKFQNLPVDQKLKLIRIEGKITQKGHHYVIINFLTLYHFHVVKYEVKYELPPIKRCHVNQCKCK